MDQKTFWTSLPGILTGTAAVLTATAGFYVLQHPTTKEIGPPSPPVVDGNSPSAGQGAAGRGTALKPMATPDPKTASTWTMVGRFNAAEGLWWTGNADEGPATFGVAFASGRYRWRAAYRGSWSRWVTPYGPITNFYEAVSFVVPEQSGGEIRVGLAFGGTAEIQYEFCLSSSGEWGLRTRKGTQVEWLFRSTPLRISFSDRNTIALIMQNGHMFFYVNEGPAGDYRLDVFKGGKVGLLLDGEGEATTAVVEFDGFELRQAPV